MKVAKKKSAVENGMKLGVVWARIPPGLAPRRECCERNEARMSRHEKDEVGGWRRGEGEEVGVDSVKK